MFRNLFRMIRAAASALMGVAVGLALPSTPSPMPSTKAIFFSSGIQQRLEVAIRTDDASSIDQLLAAGAQVNARGLHDVTPLMIAVDAQSPHAVATLLRAGANPNLKAADRAGAVHLAVQSRLAKPNGQDILAMIIKGGGDPNTRRPDGDPVLVSFTYDHDLDGIRWLHSLGADLDIVGRAREPIISGQAYAQNWDCVWVMIELGAHYDYEKTVFPLSKAISGSYASSPDSILYSYKLKVWQLFKDHGFAVKPFGADYR
ncbi:MAG: ankyrin repeat domain-containing protein [Burkholderiaceae bacterium]